MNYRHHFHAGNFADVFKHALLIQLVKAMQRKPAGLFLLDTHAGAGSYDLSRAEAGDSRIREPEHPAGIGRLWQAPGLPGPLQEYVELVREYQNVERVAPNAFSGPRHYPGSPWFLRRLAREQDRLALCELEPEAFRALQGGFTGTRVSVQQRDGYGALSAMLPPAEKRALALIDPPFETPEEWKHLIQGLRNGLRRLPAGLFAAWYPLTERAGRVESLQEIQDPPPPPTLVIEMRVDSSPPPGMKGCGMVILNPPWRFDAESETWLGALAGILGRGRAAEVSLRWLVPE